VADSNAGSIFKLSKSGKTVEKWATDELLAGDSKRSCASLQNAGLPFDIGANGIVRVGSPDPARLVDNYQLTTKVDECQLMPPGPLSWLQAPRGGIGAAIVSILTCRRLRRYRHRA